MNQLELELEFVCIGFIESPTLRGAMWLLGYATNHRNTVLEFYEYRDTAFPREMSSYISVGAITKE